MLAGSVVVPAAADGVSHPPRDHQRQADDEEENPDDQEDLGEGESRDEAREDEPEDYEDNSENDHGMQQLSD